MKLTMYQVDAFTDKLFGGNPAAVCILNSWLNDELMQQIAMENNLAETAFVVKSVDSYHIRWFTPTVEVDLCGHATLAAAHVLFNHCNYTGDAILFFSHRSGPLEVGRNGAELILNFPTDSYEAVETPAILVQALGCTPTETYKGKTDFMAVYATEQEILDIKPDFELLNALACRGVIVTAPGLSGDFVSRFFGPQSGINEDPVTGSAHTTLTPYWAARLGKTELNAIQVSARKGYLKCVHLGSRVAISGNAVTYMVGEITVAR